MPEGFEALWQRMEPYQHEINFLIFIPLFFILRSIILSKVKGVLKSNLRDNQLYPFILSLVNWGTFYAIVIYAIVYFRDTMLLGGTWFNVGSTPINTLSFIIPLLIIGLAVKFSGFVSQFFLNRLFEKHQLDIGMRYTFNRLIHYGLIVIAVLIALPTIGFDLSILTVFAGVLGIGVGFGISNIASNFISGLIILFERPIKVGDRIKLGELHCDVTQINIRSTVVRTRNNETIIIPNSQFIESQVVNWSYGDPKIREQILVGVAYGSDVRLVEELLLRAAEEQEELLTDPKPRVDFMNFGESSLDFRLLYWIPNPALRARVRSSLNFRIYELLQRHQVEIPFPQRDLHLRSVSPELLKGLQVEIEPVKSGNRGLERERQ
ncbi:mechanosensitive ion channel family protein [Desulforamulus aquiferis]|uniref:Mechanosensitive ion channel n=1 Tax=Desulforamulus aquiferis TaxID=1397668 RepID=A0AAW7ZET7_9FIRM|nr:mechanosensitive ion channel domain-containing protein [Desulforamulus aquiferis]MDO7787290.1 mechanosensitive ion channel [Desulforamulus aquiferis]